MKKLLSLVLCALMAVAMLTPAMAAEENLIHYDFEAFAEGAFTKTADGVTTANKKSGEIAVVKFGDSKVLKFKHIGSSKDTDPYVNFLENAKPGNVTKYNGGQQLVIEYDLYFEEACEKMIWSLCLSQEYPDPNGAVSWCYTALVKGADLGLYASEKAETPIMKLQLKKWYKVAVALDTAKDVYTVYLDKKPVIVEAPYTSDAGAQYTTKLRVHYKGFAEGDAVTYVDNLKIYNAAQPREVIKETPKAPQTFDAAVVLAVVSVVSASGVIVSKKRK